MENYIAIITTFNRKRKLVKAISHLKNQTFLPKKIIIVDNNSTDGTDILMNKYRNDHLIEYIVLDENIGGAGGFYVGMKKALEYAPEYIALSDDDAWYEKNYFQHIKESSENNKKIMAFIGIGEDLNTHKKTNQGSVINNKITLSVDSKLKNNKYCNVASFCGFTFKADLIKSIGLPRKDFFIWLDDKEYSLRINKISKILLVPNAIVFHPEQKRNDRGLIPYWKNYYGFRNGIILRKEYTSNQLLSNIYNIVQLVKHSISVTIVKKYKGMRIKYLKSFWLGFYDAYIHKLGKNIKFLP